MIHIFSDISVNYNNGKRFGAIIIHNDDPIIVELSNRNTTMLECESLAYGVTKAIEKYPNDTYIAHTDLRQDNFQLTISKQYFIEQHGYPFKPVQV